MPRIDNSSKGRTDLALCWPEHVGSERRCIEQPRKARQHSCLREPGLCDCTVGVCTASAWLWEEVGSPKPVKGKRDQHKDSTWNSALDTALLLFVS